MGDAFVPGLAVEKDTVLTVRRELPVPGVVTVKVGELVTPEREVARSERPGDLLVIRAAEQLLITPQELATALLVHVGQPVHAGAILARHRGLWGLLSSTITAPIGGIIEYISEGTGHIGIRSAPLPLSVSAYISGRVSAVHEGRGVTITTRGSFVQGIFGVGGERHGELFALPIGGGSPITAEVMADVPRGSIVVGGSYLTSAGLRRGVERGVAGIVVGSVDDAVLQEYLGYELGVAITGDEAVPVTVIITEGFGNLPMSSRVWDLLATCHGRQVSINGATQVRAGAVRPEIIVPESSSTDKAASARSRSPGLAIGAPVRIIRVPYFGARGEVIALPAQPEVIPTGARTRVVQVRLSDGAEVTVPRANVELL